MYLRFRAQATEIVSPKYQPESRPVSVGQERAEWIYQDTPCLA